MSVYLGLVGECVLGVDETYELDDLLHAFEIASTGIFDLKNMQSSPLAAELLKLYCIHADKPDCIHAS